MLTGNFSDRIFKIIGWVHRALLKHILKPELGERATVIPLKMFYKSEQYFKNPSTYFLGAQSRLPRTEFSESEKFTPLKI